MIWWVKTQIDKLIEEKIGLNIKVKKNDFKVAIKQLAKHMDTVAQDIKDSVKTC